MVGAIKVSNRFSRRGFSLIELLVVIFIIVVIIALILPALGGARDVAKAGATKATMSDLSNAISQFRQSNNDRDPGVFSARELGDAENASTYGFTPMENMLIELTGAIVYTDSPDGTVEKNFGPTAAAHTENTNQGRWVNTNLIGANLQDRNVYFSPKKRDLVAQERPTSQFGGGAVGNDADIPDLVDAWGVPFTAWIEDDTGPKDIQQVRDFARLDSNSGAARYYWAQNAGFLKATSLGGRGKDQTTASDTHSLIGDGVSTADIQTTMAAMLGNAGYPNAEPGDPGYTYDMLLPTAGRGGIVLMSAGFDGIFMSSADKAAKATGADSGGVRYGLNFLSTGNTRHTEDGRPVVLDRAAEFNDIFLPIGD